MMNASSDDNSFQHSRDAKLLHESKIFREQNQGALAVALTGLHEAMLAFIVRHSDNDELSNKDRDILTALSTISLDDLIALNKANQFRQMAAKFCGASSAFWALNDAFQFLSDSLNTHWKHLSMEGRAQSLLHCLDLTEEAKIELGVINPEVLSTEGPTL